MKKLICRAWFICFLTILGPATAHAVIVYNDSGVHTISQSSIPISVRNSTTVNFTGFGSATGFSRFQSGGGGIIEGDTAAGLSGNSTINFNGTRLVGGNGRTGSAFHGSTAGGDGLRLRDSYGTISGGILRGGDSLSSGSGVTSGGNGLNLDEATIVISGGTFEHGVATRSGGNALLRDGVSIQAIAGSVVDLSGGFFTSEIYLSDSILNVFGTGLMFDGTTLTGNLLNGGDTSIEINLEGTSQIFLNNTVEIAEPGAIAIFAFGLMALGSRRRR